MPKLKQHLLNGLLFVSCLCPLQAQADRVLFSRDPLVLTEDSITSNQGTLKASDIGPVSNRNKTQLANANPIIDKLWQVALHDIESNIVTTNEGTYFGAGASFGAKVYTRDISFAGILGLNELYPQIMLDSLKVTRAVHFRLKFTVSKDHGIPEINAPWEILPITEKEFFQTKHTNSYTRRTDDVIWLWAAEDLLNKMDKPDWAWLYENGLTSFKLLYDPFYDPSDGLYRGQAAFVDVHYEESRKTTGYPDSWTMQQCVLSKATSTNCLYYIGLNVMARTAMKLGRTAEQEQWQQRADNLKAAIIKELCVGDGTFVYLKEPTGRLMERREALGSALAVLSGVVQGEDARKAVAGYPASENGVPLFVPFYFNQKINKSAYHNWTSWPFVDTFFLWAKEIAENKSYSGQNLALLARTVTKNNQNFREVVDYRTGELTGSHSQLWSAAAFINSCKRAGLFPVDNKPTP